MSLIDPTTIIAEILGEPASEMRNPVNAGYLCPFINGTCTKKGHQTNDPYPVCSVFHGQRNPRKICTCPKRFYEAEFLQDIIKHCWVGNAPGNPQIAYEVNMERFGTVDFVIADVDRTTKGINQFVSVELQAVDLTGSVQSAYSATINNRSLTNRPSYGVNWANVRKRYIQQLITKGIFHHHWGTRMISVIQKPLYEYFKENVNFTPRQPTDDCNIVFMIYDFDNHTVGSIESSTMNFVEAVGTDHSSLMTGSLYKVAPDKSVFHSRIREQLK